MSNGKSKEITKDWARYVLQQMGMVLIQRIKQKWKT